MTTCPFCSAEIDDGLSRFGGNCPHCFNVIPGEEAPTDPGISPSPAVTGAVDSPSGGKTMLVFGFLAFLAIGAAIGLGGKESEVVADTESAQVALEKQARVAEDARLLALNLENQAAAEDAAAEEAEAKAEEEAAEARARARAQAAQAAAAETPDRATVDTPQDSVVETSSQIADVTGPLSTGPTRDVASGVLQTPAEINRAVRKSLRRYKGQLEQCYNIELNVDETLKGRWLVSFTVEPTGQTSGVSVKPITRPHPDLEVCMAKNVKRWSFPRIAEAYPYVKEYAFGR
jgi:hypothetical protein